ncbi:MAG TPA: uroporphyrinogen-III C-methyltransferase [Armatimonadota bacterium]|jgi:uroporphyrinogen III methyltransferase/synthase
MPFGKVFLIGAGPGDPGLLTLKGFNVLRKADVVVYDRLVHPAVLAYARSDAELIYAGKASSSHTMKQEDINRLLIEKAKNCKIVARLKGGDPFVFGRGGEEALALCESGIEFEIVPGVTSAVAVPAYAGIPVTHRGLAASFAVITGHRRDDDPASPEQEQSGIDWPKISTGIDTLVFLMGVENLPRIVSELLANGRDPGTPAALIRMGTRAEQETLVGTLADIVEKAETSAFESPAITVVGDVVGLRAQLRWFDSRPLFGKRVLVTRARGQAGALSELVRERGGEPIEFPVIKILPPESFDELDAGLRRAGEYDWLIFTSANGVSAVFARLRELGMDVRSLNGPKIGAIGPKTAEILESSGLRVDFTPDEFVSEAVVDQFPEDPNGKRILVPRSREAREVLVEGLSEKGAFVDVVTAYRSEVDDSDAGGLKEIIARGVDVVTFTSSSTVKGFRLLLGDTPLPSGVKIASIGRITAETADACGLSPDIVAEEYTIEGLVKALEEFYSKHSA